ncbi:MAG: hypothetical protein JNM22_05670 [Saprospiraceae bacterium]|nr:hypothetical protein [Saprospiraceae bacterium]
MSTKKAAAEALEMRKRAAQRLIDKSETSTGAISIVTGTRRKAGKLVTVKFQPNSAPKVATS